MARGPFTAQVEALVVKTEKNMLAVTRQSLQDVVNQAQLPVAKGGRMRVDTGFLRASGQASLNGMPTGPVRGDSKIKNFYDDGASQPIIVQLGTMKLGSVFHFGWTAAYARYRETYDGFLTAALQNWQSIVNKNVAEANARSPGAQP